MKETPQYQTEPKPARKAFYDALYTASSKDLLLRRAAIALIEWEMSEGRGDAALGLEIARNLGWEGNDPGRLDMSMDCAQRIAPLMKFLREGVQ